MHPTLPMVPRCLAAASGRGSDSYDCDASQEAFCSGTLRLPSVAEAMEAGFLPALDKDQADMFTPSPPGRRSCSCTDTLRTTGY